VAALKVLPYDSPAIHEEDCLRRFVGHRLKGQVGSEDARATGGEMCFAGLGKPLRPQLLTRETIGSSQTERTRALARILYPL
jgi:hypothetical protein